MLAKRWQEHEDDSKRRMRLVTSHLRLVAKIAMGYRGYGLPVSELISEGNVGMMQAVKRFDPDKGFRLATYAMWWIRASIQEYILHSWSLVKMGTTAAQKKLFFNLRKLKGQPAGDRGGRPASRERHGKIADRAERARTRCDHMNRRWPAAGPFAQRPMCARTAKASGRTGWWTRPTSQEAVELGAIARN